MKKEKKDLKNLDKDSLLKLIAEVQVADVAKTRMRQTLREKNQSDVEEYLCPEIYNKKKPFFSKFKTILSILAACISIAFAILRFAYVYQRDAELDRQKFVKQMAIIEERNNVNSSFLTKIENNTTKMSDDLDTLHNSVSIVNYNIGTMSNQIKNQSEKISDVDKRLSIMEHKVK